jgi:hypothetical protein
VSHNPSDPFAFFDRVGEAYVRKALVNGEFKAPLDRRAILWLEQVKETASRSSQRHVIGWMIATAVVTLATGTGATVATLLVR